MHYRRLNSIGVLVYALLAFSAGARGEVFDGARVREVITSDFSEEEKEFIARKLGIMPGSTIDSQKVDAGIRELFESGRIQSLLVDAEAAGSAEVTLTIRGNRRRPVSKIAFVGVEQSMVEEVGRLVPLSGKGSTSEQVVPRLREVIALQYMQKGFYQAKIEVREKVIGEGNEAEIEVQVEPGAPSIVKQVTFSDPELAQSLKLKQVVKVHPGDVITKKSLDESVLQIKEALLSSQYPAARIEEPKLEVSADRSKVDVMFRFRAGERYQFLFEGNRIFESYELRSLLTADVVSQNDAVSRIAELIDDKYKSIGFHFCKVTVESSVQQNDDASVIRFRIVEGERVRVGTVAIGGVESIGTDDVRRWFYEGAPGVLARGIYVQSAIPQAVKVLQERLNRMGYLTARVLEPRTVFASDRRRVDLYMDIELGTKTVVAEVQWVGLHDVSEAELNEELAIRPGQAFSKEELDEGKKKVLTYLGERGFADAKFETAETKVEISKDRKAAVLRMVLKQGIQYRVGKVQVDGLRKTEEEVVLRELKLKSGDVYNPKLVIQSEENVSGLGLFSRSEVVPVASSTDPERKDLRVIVRETKPGLAEVGVGAVYEEPRLRIRSFAGAAYRNLFGRNQTTSIRVETAVPLSVRGPKVVPFLEYATILGYRTPYTFGLPFAFFAQVSLDSFEVSPIGPRIQSRARFESRIEKRFAGKHLAFYRLFRYERTTTEILRTPDVDREFIGSTGPGIVLDFRDDLYNPSSGTLHSLDFEVGAPALLSQNNIGFFLGLLRNSAYVPLFSPFRLNLFAGAGFAQSLLGSNPVPTARLTNEMSLGGQLSIRGIAPRAIVPDLNSTRTAFVNLRAELLTELFTDVSFAVFMDSGQIFPNLVARPRSDGIGLGLRYKTPIGPIVLDFAQGFGPNAEAVKFYFTVGTI